MVEQLLAHVQLDCCMGYGATTSSCFGQDGNSQGSKVERQTLEDMQVENEDSLGALDSRNLRACWRRI